MLLAAPTVVEFEYLDAAFRTNYHLFNNIKEQ